MTAPAPTDLTPPIGIPVATPARTPIFQGLAAMLGAQDQFPADAEIVTATRNIAGEVPGWSRETHYAFFKALLDVLKPDFASVLSSPRPLRLLMLGVYQGRDLVFLNDAARRYHPNLVLECTGVDAFSDAACADWPEDLKDKTWEQAGFGPAPSLDKATDNLRKFGFDEVMLLKMPDEKFLARSAQMGRKWDVVYIDTAHDEATVVRQIGQVLPLLAGPKAIICGDDFSSERQPTWGVDRAVKAAFGRFGLFNRTIWFATADMAKAQVN